MKAPKATFSGEHGVYKPLAKYKDCEFTPAEKGQITKKIKGYVDQNWSPIAIVAHLNSTSSIVWTLEDVIELMQKVT